MIYKFKICSDCGEHKPISHFHRRRSSSDGKMSYCSACNNIRSIAWQKKMKWHVSSWRVKWRAKSPRQSLNVSLNGALKRCPTKNPASISDVMGLWDKQAGKCAISGIAMTWAQGKLMPTSITLDRINPEVGYEIKNIRLVCHAINSFKGRMGDAEMLKMAMAIVSYAARIKKAA